MSAATLRATACRESRVGRRESENACPEAGKPLHTGKGSYDSRLPHGRQAPPDSRQRALAARQKSIKRVYLTTKERPTVS
jgi:hypothetical protein